MAVREGHIRIGDTVAVFGLGAIGLMAVQLAKLSGALTIIGVEPIEKRRCLAETYGADLLLNPFEIDVGQKVKNVTDSKGVDISIDTSGSYRALHEAIRATRFGGAIIPVSWYHGEATGLNLGEEWHFNRQVMISGARVESEPYRDYPLWDKRRIYGTVLELFRKKRLTSQGMLSPITKFEDAVKAYRMLAKKPEETIKLGVVYS
jgi:threonine dehydrogenase-like Zn-dependent dehydrogenase